MAHTTTRLTDDALAFLSERHLAMLTTLRADNSPHVVAVGFTFDPKTHMARVITSGGSQKALNAGRGGVAVLSQVDGARWLSLEGRATVNGEIAAVRDAELRYAQRYRTPRANPRRVVIEVHVERVLGSSDLLDRSRSE
jgi:F420H(2)-dependent biliverdin reductase